MLSCCFLLLLPAACPAARIVLCHSSPRPLCGAWAPAMDAPQEAPPLDTRSAQCGGRRRRRGLMRPGGAQRALSCALGAALLARGFGVGLPPLETPLVAHPPHAPPPLSVQAAAAAAYAEWSKKDQYKYSASPLKVNPLYGTDMTHGDDGTTFYSNMPVTWLVTQISGGRHASYRVLTQTENHLQLAGAGTPGVWRITAAAVSCLDTCAPNCGAATCTAQLDSAACTSVAAGLSRPGDACKLAYTVVHYRVLARWQVGIAVLLFLAGFAAVYFCINGADAGMPGLWMSSSGTSWTVKPAARAAPVAPPTLVARTGNTRLKLDIDDEAAGAATRPVARMYRNAAEQEKTALLL